MGSTAQRNDLKKKLASLIGFDDVNDLMEHCIALEDDSERLEFLQSLLCQTGENVTQFCQDVGRWRKGETITSLKPMEDIEDNKKERVALDYTCGASTRKKKTKNGTSTGKEVSQPLGKHEKQVSRKMKKEKLPPKKREKKINPNNQKGTVTSKSKSKEQNRDSVEKPNDSRKKENRDEPNEVASEQNSLDLQHCNLLEKKNMDEPSLMEETQTEVPPNPLERGKADVVCGCFGTKHKPLTNCLYCGRIACKVEGYGFCPFCGYLINGFTKRTVGDNAMEKALLHKERLLKFDMEFTQRTKVYDDQADYFVNSTSAWMTQEEQVDAEEKDRKRRSEMHDRKKQVLNLAI